VAHTSRIFEGVRVQSELDRFDPGLGLPELIGLFAVAECVRDDILAENVIAQPVVTPANPPLPFAWIDACKLFDLALAAVIVGGLPGE
jgi:hypothetical protein